MDTSLTSSFRPPVSKCDVSIEVSSAEQPQPTPFNLFLLQYFILFQNFKDIRSSSMASSSSAALRPFGTARLTPGRQTGRQTQQQISAPEPMIGKHFSRLNLIQFTKCRARPEYKKLTQIFNKLISPKSHFSRRTTSESFRKELPRLFPHWFNSTFYNIINIGFSAIALSDMEYLMRSARSSRSSGR